MNSKRPWTLRAQLALAMTLCVVATVAIGYGGLTLFGEWQTQQFWADLSPEANRARLALEQGVTPPAADFERLQREASALEAELYAGQNWALGVLSIIAIGAGAGLGAILSSRISAPLADVARAARQIAGGDLTGRALAAPKGAGEITQLVTDFNHMAAALEVAERELNANAAAIAHELRTPLTVLKGYVQGALDGVFEPDQAHLERLLHQIDGLARLVDDLRTLSLAESGRLTVDLQRLDLADAARDAAESMRWLLTADGLALELDLQPAPMVGDAGRLRQAIMALLENVRRHARSGRRVRVETFAIAGRATARVVDAGPGLAPEDCEKAFDRFWRRDPSRAKESGGSGLGLSVVHAIVKAQAGNAAMFNPPAGGLCVELSFLQATDTPVSTGP